MITTVAAAATHPFLYQVAGPGSTDEHYQLKRKNYSKEEPQDQCHTTQALRRQSPSHNHLTTNHVLNIQGYLNNMWWAEKEQPTRAGHDATNDATEARQEAQQGLVSLVDIHPQGRDIILEKDPWSPMGILLT